MLPQPPSQLWRAPELLPGHICESLPICCAGVLQVSDPSLLRFLVDLRDADIDDKQLRDDLMTMLIAGHETTAAVLTWALFELMQHPQAVERCLQEIDEFVGDGAPGGMLGV